MISPVQLLDYAEPENQRLQARTNADFPPNS